MIVDGVYLKLLPYIRELMIQRFQSRLTTNN